MKSEKKIKVCRIVPLGIGLLAILVLATRPGQAIPFAPKADAIAKIVAADNRFGLRLFEEARKKDKNVNVCMSPASIALALQMTYNGASGTTRVAMAKALELGGMSLNAVNQSSHALLDSLALSAAGSPSDKKAQFNIANSLWIKDAQSLMPDFMQRAQQYYKAETGSLQGAPQSINAWVSRQTNNKIRSIVSGPDLRDADVVLVNAVYFKGIWETPFPAGMTANKPFHLTEGGTKTCKMMAQTGQFRYYQGEAMQMVSLPYQGSSLEMVIALPKAGMPLSALAGRLTPEKWQQWTEKMASAPGTLELPRFRAEYSVELKDALSGLGMGEAFSKDADFSAMSRTKSLHISKVLHKTYVDVNEQGTEAAAATAVIMAPKSARPPVTVPFQMTVDRSFLYAIRDRQTGALLFVGTLARPQ